MRVKAAVRFSLIDAVILCPSSTAYAVPLPPRGRQKTVVLGPSSTADAVPLPPREGVTWLPSGEAVSEGD